MKHEYSVVASGFFNAFGKSMDRKQENGKPITVAVTLRRSHRL